MTQFVTIRVVYGSDADLFLVHTIWCMRTIQFDGTVVYSYDRTPDEYYEEGYYV